MMRVVETPRAGVLQSGRVVAERETPAWWETPARGVSTWRGKVTKNPGDFAISRIPKQNAMYNNSNVLLLVMSY